MVSALHTLFTQITLDQVTTMIGMDPEYMDLTYTGPKTFKFKEYVYKEAYDALPAAFKAFLSELDGEEFYLMLASATTTEAVSRYGWDSTSETAQVSKQNSKVNQFVGKGDVTEMYYDYKSPYALYVAWLKANGYVQQ